MALQQRGTIGELEFGGFPLGNVAVLAVDASVDGGNILEVELYGSGGVAFSDLAQIDWDDGSPKSAQAITSHTYSGTQIYTPIIAAQPDFDKVVEAFLFLDRRNGLDNGGGFTTALVWDGANNDFQPAPSQTFQVDAVDGTQIAFEMIKGVDGPRNIRYLTGEGETGEGENSTIQYNSSGSFTAEIVTQPGFSSVVDALINPTGYERITLNGNPANALIWDDPNNDLKIAPEFEFTVTPESTSDQLDVDFGGSFSDVVEVIIHQSGTVHEVISYSGDFPYSNWKDTNPHTLTFVAAPDWTPVKFLSVGAGGNSIQNGFNFRWKHPNTLTSLPNLEDFGQTQRAEYEFDQISVNDNSKVKKVGDINLVQEQSQNQKTENLIASGALHADILDKYTNLERLLIGEGWGVADTNYKPGDLSDLHTYSQLRNLALPTNNDCIPPRGLITVDFAGGGGSDKFSADGWDPQNATGGPVPFPYFRHWTRVQKIGEKGAAEDYYKDLHRSRFQLMRLAPVIYFKTGQDDQAGAMTGYDLDGNKVTTFWTAVAGVDVSADPDTITFDADLRPYTITFSSGSYDTDAFPDPTDSTATDPSGKELWQGIDGNYKVLGDSDSPNERVFLVRDPNNSVDVYMTADQAGSVSSGQTTVTLGSEGSKNHVWESGMDRSNGWATLEDYLNDGNVATTEADLEAGELNDSVRGAGVIVIKG